MSEDTHVSFLEDELRYASERCEALATQRADLTSAIRTAVKALSLANYPEYDARKIAGEVCNLLIDAITKPKEKP